MQHATRRLVSGVLLVKLTVLGYVIASAETALFRYHHDMDVAVSRFLRELEEDSPPGTTPPLVPGKREYNRNCFFSPMNCRVGKRPISLKDYVQILDSIEQ